MNNAWHYQCSHSFSTVRSICPKIPHFTKDQSVSQLCFPYLTGSKITRATDDYFLFWLIRPLICLVCKMSKNCVSKATSVASLVQSEVQRFYCHEWKRKVRNPHIEEAGLIKCLTFFAQSSNHCSPKLDDLLVCISQQVSVKCAE